MDYERQVAGKPVGPGPRPSEILVVGLGNPILGDDGAGWRVANEVKARLDDPGGTIEVDCASLGGLSLMERMLGYQRVILVDTIASGATPDGTVSVYALSDLPDPKTGHTASAHDASLMTALKAAELMGAAVPARVDIVAIEARSCYDFSEVLSPAIAAAVPIATSKVQELLEMGPER
jgi:hydrogenase maturation protease